MRLFYYYNNYPVFTDSGIFIHRWIAEKILKRKLKKGEVVHHKDRNPKNFHPNNLVVMNRDEHDRLHGRLISI